MGGAGLVSTGNPGKNAPNNGNHRRMDPWLRLPKAPGFFCQTEPKQARACLNPKIQQNPGIQGLVLGEGRSHVEWGEKGGFWGRFWSRFWSRSRVWMGRDLGFAAPGSRPVGMGISAFPDTKLSLKSKVWGVRRWLQAGIWGLGWGSFPDASKGRWQRDGSRAPEDSLQISAGFSFQVPGKGTPRLWN